MIIDYGKSIYCLNFIHCPISLLCPSPPCTVGKSLFNIFTQDFYCPLISPSPYQQAITLIRSNNISI